MQNEISLSTPPVEGLALWRSFLESAFALIDILDVELQSECGLSLRWYDVLVHLEEAPGGLRMSEVADRILASKSGLTRVVDRMLEAGLVLRERPEDDRRVVLVAIAPAGVDVLQRARAAHRRGVQEHFLQHLEAADRVALAAALDHVRRHVRPLRPGRVRG